MKISSLNASVVRYTLVLASLAPMVLMGGQSYAMTLQSAPQKAQTTQAAVTPEIESPASFLKGTFTEETNQAAEFVGGVKQEEFQKVASTTTLCTWHTCTYAISGCKIKKSTSSQG